MHSRMLLNTAAHVIALMAGAAVFAPAASASTTDGERWPRWYVGLSGGVAFLNDTDFKGSARGELRSNTGALGTVSLGYRPYFGGDFLDSLRFELEGGYHANGSDGATLNGVPTAANRDLTAWTLMGNAYYDFRTGSQWTPYLGGGLGWARVGLDKTSGLGNTSEGDKVFGYQLMTGISYAPTSIPLTEWSLGYRYLSLQNPEFYTATGKLKFDNLVSHNVELGARFQF